MSAVQAAPGGRGMIDGGRMADLLALLSRAGYRVVGPRERDGVIVFDEIRTVGDLPRGRGDRQEKATYRLTDRGDGRWFGFNVGADSAKRWLFPPARRLLTAHSDGRFEAPVPASTPVAVIGLRGCDLAAIRIQDRVFLGGAGRDPDYASRRRGLLIVAVNCSTAAATCFCTSMGTGPQVGAGFDLRLTETLTDGHRLLIEAGSPAGERLLAGLAGAAPVAEAAAAGLVAAETAAAAGMISRRLSAQDAATIKEKATSPAWADAGARCLACANCTMVCPTCFCQSVEDRPDMDLTTVERWASWDSCFNPDHSYIHGGAVRQDTTQRYRQWLTHKLSTWHDQFGTSGCTGCGRCIAWCPVGIDLTEEAARIVAAQEAES